MNAPPRHIPHPKSTLPARAAARRLRYTADYVAKLCRDGKLDCVQIEGAWFVQKDSLIAFKAGQPLRRAIRATSLSRLRREQLHREAAPLPQQRLHDFWVIALFMLSIIACMALSIAIAIPIH